MMNKVNGGLGIRYQEKMKLVMSSPNITQYEMNRLETGISKPSIFSGLNPNHFMGVPKCFVADVMHLPALNVTEHFFELWRAKTGRERRDTDPWLFAVLTGKHWIEFGQEVAENKTLHSRII